MTDDSGWTTDPPTYTDDDAFDVAPPPDDYYDQPDDHASAGPVMPFDSGIEKTVIATALGDTVEARRLAEEHGLRPAHFWIPDHRALWSFVVHRLQEAEQPFDAALLRRELDRNPDWREGLDTQRVMAAAGDAVAEHQQHGVVAHGQHAVALIDLTLRRESIQTAVALLEAAGNSEVDIGETIARTDEQMMLLQSQTAQGTWVTLFDTLAREIPTYGAKGSQREIVSTTLPSLDDLTGGVGVPQMVVIGARPSMGKSAFCQQIGAHVALGASKPVLMFTAEMTDTEVAARFMANHTGTPLGVFTRPNHPQAASADWFSILEVGEDVRTKNLLIWDKPNQTINTIVSMSRNAAQRYGGVALIIVDYVGLLDQVDASKPQIQHLEEVTRRLKNLSGELDCTVLALSQLNRKLEERPNKRPQLSDLRSTGSLEQDANQVWFLYRGEVYGEGDPGAVEIIVAKNRGGRTGTVVGTFDGPRVRFIENRQQPLGNTAGGASGDAMDAALTGDLPTWDSQ